VVARCWRWSRGSSTICGGIVSRRDANAALRCALLDSVAGAVGVRHDSARSHRYRVGGFLGRSDLVGGAAMITFPAVDPDLVDIGRGVVWWVIGGTIVGAILGRVWRWWS
jgi:hypothetical protein